MGDKDNSKELFKEYEALVRFFHKKELKIKEAICFDKRVSYFRNDDFIKMIQDHHVEIPKIMKSWTFEKSLSEESEAKKFISDLLENKIIWKLERGQEEPKYKWPKKLMISKDQAHQNDAAFYSFVITPKSKSTKVLTILALSAIVAICLFQVWPLKLKLAVFYTSVALLYILIGLILVRLAVYIFFRILGFNAYIFPNLFEEVSFIESFKPFFSFDKCEDGTIGYVARAFGLVLLAYLMFRLSQEPEIIQEYQNIATQSYDDIISWGVGKLEGQIEIVDKNKDFKKLINDLLDAADQDEALEKQKKEGGDTKEGVEPIEDVDVDKYVQDAVEKDSKKSEGEKTAQEVN